MKGLVGGLLAAFVRLVTGIQVRWTGCAPSAAQRIYFANHSSHLDFVALWAAFPPEVRSLTRPVAARDYWEKGAIRRWLAAEVFRAVLVDRGGQAGGDRKAAVEAARRTVERTAEALGETGSLVLFPEGTRGTGEEIAPFKAGLYHVAAARPGVELIPCRLVNLNRILPKGEVVPVPFMSYLTIGPPMLVEPGESKAAFLARAREAVVSLGAA
jgi:1-acyl-sn-glycerol-3-phosphate acyltransferase